MYKQIAQKKIKTSLWIKIISGIIILSFLANSVIDIPGLVIKINQQENLPGWKKVFAQSVLKLNAFFGNSDSQKLLAFFYLGAPKDPLHFSYDLQKAKYWAQKAVDQHDPFAYKFLMKIEDLVNVNDIKSINEKAKHGDAQSEYQLGMIYLRGIQVTHNYTLAIAWLNKSAMHGNGNAAYILGKLYEYGPVVAVDKKQAVFWLQKATDAGNALAANDLGVLYHRGDGVEKNSTKAEEFYKLAAERGDYGAMYNMGLHYSHLDNPKDPVEKLDFAMAASWYKKSLQVIFNPCAAHDLGILYATGNGVPQNAADAKSLFKRSIFTLMMGVPEGDEIKIDDTVNKTDLIQTYAEYQYSQVTHTGNSEMVEEASPDVMSAVKDLSGKIVEICWE